MIKKRLFSLIMALTLLLLCGCSGETIPTQPTDETATDPAPTSSMMPTETQWYNPEWVGCEVITPEEGVLILREDTVLENTVVDGDVYITANAQVSFVHVWVRGKLFAIPTLILQKTMRRLSLISEAQFNKT